MLFNVNYEVRVKLREPGRRLLRKQSVEQGIPPWPPSEDADGWSKWQLWHLMQTFGAAMYNGCDMPFETMIDIMDRHADG